MSDLVQTCAQYDHGDHHYLPDMGRLGCRTMRKPSNRLIVRAKYPWSLLIKYRLQFNNAEEQLARKNKRVEESVDVDNQLSNLEIEPHTPTLG